MAATLKTRVTRQRFLPHSWGSFVYVTMTTVAEIWHKKRQKRQRQKRRSYLVYSPVNLALQSWPLGQLCKPAKGWMCDPMSAFIIFDAKSPCITLQSGGTNTSVRRRRQSPNLDISSCGGSALVVPSLRYRQPSSLHEVATQVDVWVMASLSAAGEGSSSEAGNLLLADHPLPSHRGTPAGTGAKEPRSLSPPRGPKGSWKINKLVGGSGRVGGRGWKKGPGCLDPPPGGWGALQR